MKSSVAIIFTLLILQIFIQSDDITIVFRNLASIITSHLLLYIGGLAYLIGITTSSEKGEQTQHVALCVFFMGLSLEHWSGAFALILYLATKSYFTKLG